MFNVVHVVFFLHSSTRQSEARSAKSCNVDGKVYKDGEQFTPNCSQLCTCQNGQYACASLCPSEDMAPSRDHCREAQLLSIGGRCCREWVCPHAHSLPRPEDSVQRSSESIPPILHQTSSFIKHHTSSNQWRIQQFILGGPNQVLRPKVEGGARIEGAKRPSRRREAPENWGRSPNRGRSPRKNGGRGLGRGLGEPLPRKFWKIKLEIIHFGAYLRQTFQINNNMWN